MHEHASVSQHGQTGQYLSFRLGDDDYAVDILRVKEIRGWERARALPDSPAYVKGVLDLRGTIVPVIDLRLRFGAVNPEYSTTTVVVILSVNRSDAQGQLVGVVVDGVSDVLDIDTADLKAPPRVGSTLSQGYLAGMLSLPRGMVILIDLDKLFDSAEMDRLQGMPGG